MQINKNIKGSKSGEINERFTQQGDQFLKHKTSDLFLNQQGNPLIQKVAISWRINFIIVTPRPIGYRNATAMYIRRV